MQIEYAFLAEAAEAHNGRFFVLGGGLTNLLSTGLPAMLPSVSLVVKCRLDEAEWQRGVAYKILVRKPDGQSYGENVEGTFEQGALNNAGRPYFQVLAINFRGLVLELHGRYEFEIEADGAIIGTVGFDCDPAPGTQLKTPASKVEREEQS